MRGNLLVLGCVIWFYVTLSGWWLCGFAGLRVRGFAGSRLRYPAGVVVRVHGVRATLSGSRLRYPAGGCEGWKGHVIWLTVACGWCRFQVKKKTLFCFILIVLLCFHFIPL